MRVAVERLPRLTVMDMAGEEDTPEPAAQPASPVYSPTVQVWAARSAPLAQRERARYWCRLRTATYSSFTPVPRLPSVSSGPARRGSIQSH
jgi:hypothetical protein